MATPSTYTERELGYDIELFELETESGDLLAESGHVVFVGVADKYYVTALVFVCVADLLDQPVNAESLDETGDLPGIFLR